VTAIYIFKINEDIHLVFGKHPKKAWLELLILAPMCIVKMNQDMQPRD